MNILEILLGQIPEAIYFALFMIYTKRLDKKRGLFVMLMIIEYILLFIPTLSIWSYILYFVISYIILKLLYKEKSQITDIFTLGIASLILMVISAIWYGIIYFTIKNIIVCNVLAKSSLFIFLYIIKSKLPKIQNVYKLLWNRNDKIPKHMKSTTFRCINVILFNFMFFVINSYVIFFIIRTRRC